MACVHFNKSKLAPGTENVQSKLSVPTATCLLTQFRMNVLIIIVQTASKKKKKKKTTKIYNTVLY